MGSEVLAANPSSGQIDCIIGYFAHKRFTGVIIPDLTIGFGWNRSPGHHENSDRGFILDITVLSGIQVSSIQIICLRVVLVHLPVDVAEVKIIDTGIFSTIQ